MTNINCLENIMCPHCFSEDHFYITCSVVACVSVDGAEPASVNFRWDESSAISCPNCYHDGTVADFTWESPVLKVMEVGND